MDNDIFNWDKRMHRALENLKNSDLSNHNKELILKFDEYSIRSEMSVGRRMKYMNQLMTIASRWLKKDFDRADKHDIEHVIAQIQQTKTKVNSKEGLVETGRNYSESTKLDFKTTLKVFYWWLRGEKIESIRSAKKRIFPPEVDWIELRIKQNNRKLPEEMLSLEEINRLIEVGKNAKEKAFAAVLAESGCRSCEILNLKVKNVEFDDIGANITVNGKTGARPIPLVMSAPHLKEWLNAHPFKDNKESFVWIITQKRRDRRLPEMFGKPMSHKAASRLLQTLKKRSGITKRVNLHNFRHSRATYLATVLTEPSMRIYFGWSENSRMPQKYEHMSMKNVKKVLYEHYGVERQMNVCGNCKEINKAGSKYCQRCGMPLNYDTAAELDAKRKFDEFTRDLLLTLAEKNPEVKKIALQLAKEKGIKEIFE